MSEEAIYVEVSADGKIRNLLPDALIDRNLIDEDGFSFSFPEITDITDSLKKNRDKTKPGNRDGDNILNAQNKGRMYYGRLTCTYPNGEYSNSIAIKDCIIQYSPGLTKATSTYADTFLVIGISEYIIDKLKSEAKKQSSITLALKDKVHSKNGHYWFGCNLEKIIDHKLNITSSTTKTMLSVDIKKYLTSVQSNLLADIQFEVSATVTTDSLFEKINNMSTAVCSLTLKPNSINVKSKSTVEAPQTVDFQARVTETFAISEESYADDDLVKLAQQLSGM